MVRNYVRKSDRALTYSREKLREAIALVKAGALNSSRAAVVFNIPRTTLYGHVAGKVCKSNTLGKPPALSIDVEKTLFKNLKSLQDNGFNLQRSTVLELVGLFLNSNNIDHPFKSGKPGEYWLQAFCKRHDFNPKPVYKEFGVKERDVIIVKEFYNVLEMRINEMELADKPGQIWHVEEHSFYKGKRVANDEKLKDITFVTACSAEGKKAPLLTVFKGEESHDWMLGKHINVSHSRGMCAEVFKDYFQTVFLNYIDDSRPNLVIFEAQSSLIDLDVVAEATKANVTIVKCPRYLEGLDMSIGKTLKLRASATFKGSTKEFANFIADVFDGVQVSEIEDDFKNAGVHPFVTVPDSKFDDDQLKMYEEYEAFKERHLNSCKVDDTEEVMVKEDIEFQENFVMESDDCSSSTSMTLDEAESPSTGSSQELLRRVLIAVKKDLTDRETSSLNGEMNLPEYPGTNADTMTHENRLIAWISGLSNAGFAVTQENLTEAVESLGGSYEEFLNQHPELKDKTSKNLSFDKVTAESVKFWLVCIKRYLKKNNLEDVLNSPRRIFTFGEVGLSLNPEDQAIKKTGSEDVTVSVTASADGNTQAPSVIFPFKLPDDFTPSWTKAEILNDYITDVFYPWLIENKVSFPLILFMDRTTHINLYLSEFLKGKRIIPIALLSNELQPLETVFKSLRIYWKENNQAIQKLKKEQLTRELESYTNRDFRKEISDSFKACGIHPFNPNIKHMNETDRFESRIENSETETANKNISLLEEVEKRIANDVLEGFKKSSDSWNGNPMHCSLFEFWKGIREECSKETQEAEDSFRLNVDNDVFEVVLEPLEQLRKF